MLLNFRSFVRSAKFLTVDDCNMDKLLESSWRLLYTTRCQESQGSLAVVFDQTFTSGYVDLRANLFTDHRRSFIFRVLNFRGLDREIVSTAKFSRSTVHILSVIYAVFSHL